MGTEFKDKIVLYWFREENISRVSLQRLMVSKSEFTCGNRGPFLGWGGYEFPCQFF